LILAARNGHSGVVSILLSHGANIESKDAHGYTALMIAASHNFSETVVVLLSFGASVESVELEGKTALAISVSRCSWTSFDVIAVDMIRKGLGRTVIQQVSESSSSRHQAALALLNLKRPLVQREMCWLTRRSYLSLMEAYPETHGHIVRYLFDGNLSIVKEVCSFAGIDADILTRG
jgi:hypothetical protein